MKQFVAALRASVAEQNHYAALMSALTLPDICRGLDDPSKKGAAGYAAWFDQWVGPKYRFEADEFMPAAVFLSGKDAYALRCAFLHQGEFDTLEQRAREAIDKFSFLFPKAVVGFIAIK